MAHPRSSPVRRGKNKTLRERRQRQLDIDDLRTWWIRCVGEHEIFRATVPVENEDYTGSLPWPDFVKSRALYDEFVSYTGVGLSYADFAQLMNRMTDFREKQNMTIRKRDHRGRIIQEGQRVFYSLRNFL